MNSPPAKAAPKLGTYLVLVRGLPGSGKTTLSRKLIRSLSTRFGQRAEQINADMFFGMRGERFNRFLLSRAHKWCFQKAFKALAAGTVVFVDNTFVKPEELHEYTDESTRRGIPVLVLELNGRFTSTHAVPEATLKDMAANFWTIPAEDIQPAGVSDPHFQQLSQALRHVSSSSKPSLLKPAIKLVTISDEQSNSVSLEKRAMAMT